MKRYVGHSVIQARLFNSFYIELFAPKRASYSPSMVQVEAIPASVPEFQAPIAAFELHNSMISCNVKGTCHVKGDMSRGVKGDRYNDIDAHVKGDRYNDSHHVKGDTCHCTCPLDTLDTWIPDCPTYRFLISDIPE